MTMNATQEIEVRVSLREVMEQHRLTLESYLIAKCKEAGIPLVGLLAFRGVESGVVERIDDPASGDFVFRWRPS